MATTHSYALTMRDATGESSSMKVYNGPVTVGTIAGYLTLIGTLKTKTDALVLGVAASEQWVGDNTDLSSLLPTTNYAQRENKLLVRYVGDTTGKRYTLTIPTVDLELLEFVDGGKDAVRFSGSGVNAAVTEWVTAFEAVARTPDDDTETVTVVGMQFVGRNI